MDVVQFVDSIAASPTVRLNLNDGTTWGLNYQGTDISPPALKQAWASTLLVDGEKLTAAAYNNRRLKLSLDLMTASQDASATALQALWRELNRPYNLLKWQPEGMTSPVFFRTIRSSNTRVTDYPGGGSLRTVEVEIEAEPFAYGLREALSAVTVSNDPAAASNGMFLDVASPKGDVETPLFLSVRASDVAVAFGGPSGGRRQSVIAVRRGGTPSATPVVLQAESMTASLGTTAQAASGSSGTFLRTSFASNENLRTRASIDPWPASPSTDVRGTYRVFLRCRQSVATDVMRIQMWYSRSSTIVASDVVTGPADTLWRWVDMGLMQRPLGYDPVSDGLSGSPIAVSGLAIEVQTGRDSGTGSLDMDVLMFVPADDRLALVKWPESANATTEAAYVVDPVAGQAYGVGNSGELRSPTIELIGAAPMVSPGVANRVWFLRDVGPTFYLGDEITASVQITPYYWPRYLTVRGS